MGTIKEERDALLTRKLKEVGEMGSNPHTLENSPFFDPPNELFFKKAATKIECDKANQTESALEKYADNEKTEPQSNRPLEDGSEQLEEELDVVPHREKSSKANQLRRGTAQRRADFAEYQQRFLAPNVFEIRTQFTVNKETTDLMRIILQDLGSRTTLTAYIENILRDHISEYRDLINQVTAKRRRKETIPE